MKKQLLWIGFVLLVIEIQAQTPSINFFNPVSGPVGTQVTITGANFSTTAANNVVYFGAVKATVSAASANSLTVTVPLGAGFHPISVAVNNLIGYSRDRFAVTYPGGGMDFSSSSFAAAANHTGGPTIAEGDFDGDGKIDFVYTKFPDNYIGVRRNTSVGTTVSFAPAQMIGGVVNPINVTTADLDADGLPDVIVANPTFNLVYVLKNTSSAGTIKFASSQSFITGGGPRTVIVSDIDNDGKGDIITANESGNSISILRNTSSGGSISFASKLDFAAAGSGEGICTGYMDNDDKIDIMVACSSANAVSVFKNTSVPGSIALNARTDYGVGIYPWDVAAADLDGDGKPELVSTSNGSNNISVFRNISTASISFAPKIDFSTGVSPRGVLISDLNADGKPEIVTANYFYYSDVSVLKNNSVTGSLSFADRIPFGTYTGPVKVVAADFNGDGLMDLMSSNSANGGNISVLVNQLPISTGIPLCPALLAPANNAANIAHSIPLQFKWKKDRNASGYKLKITPQGGTAIEITTSDTSYMFSPSAGTTYTWTVTPLNLTNPATVCNIFTFSTCAVVANTVTINAMGATDKCGTDSVLVRASSNIDLQWLFNGSTIPGANADSIWVKNAGNYSVRTLVGACYAEPSNTITISNLATPVKPMLYITGDTAICEGGSVLLTSSLANNNNLWFKNTVAIAANGNSYTVNEAGSFYVRVTDNNTGCHNYSDTVNVKVNPIPATPAITIVTGSTSLCETEAIKMSSSAATGNKWYRDNILIPGVTSKEYTTTQAGNYTVQVTVKNCTSASSAGLNVTVKPLPPRPVITRIAGVWPFCVGDSITISSSAATGNQWYKNDVIMEGVTSRELVVKEKARFSVRVTGENGCLSPFYYYNAETIPSPATPVITIVSGSTTFCEPGTVKLSSSAAAANQWYRDGVLIPGATGNEYISGQTGAYTVKVTEGSCSSVSPATIVTVHPVPAAPSITTVSGTATFCSGDSTTLSSSATTNNQWYKNDVAIAGATNRLYTAKETGNYTVKVIQDGCESASSGAANILANSLPAKPVINATGNSLSTAGGYAGYKWYLNNTLIPGANSHQYDVTQSGIYKVEVADDKGCKNSSDDFNVVYTDLIDIIVEGYSIKVYPNPVIEDVFIKVSSANWSGSKLSISVADLNGKILQTVYLRPGSNRISLKNCAAGVYTFILAKGNIRKAVKILKVQ